MRLADKQRSQQVQDRLRDEINATRVELPTADTVNKLPYLTSVIYELLRLYPPISQLTNRVALSDAFLGDNIPVPSNTYIGWNAYGVHTSVANWGTSAKSFIPERWGSSVEEMQLKFRRDTIRGTFIPFNAHSRKCLGQAFVLLQMKIAVFELVRSIRWKVDPAYELKFPGVSDNDRCLVYRLPLTFTGWRPCACRVSNHHREYRSSRTGVRGKFY